MRRWRIFRAGHQPGGLYWCHPGTAQEARSFVYRRRHDNVQYFHRNDCTSVMEDPMLLHRGPFVICIQEDLETP